MKFNRFAASSLAVALFASNLTFAQNNTANQTRAANAGATQRGSLPDIKYTEFKLKNGLRVIFHEDKSVPIVGVNLWYHVGSKNEVQGRTGFAHLFEHMMFQGSKNYDDDYFKPIQEAGGTLNGSTNPDRTNYWEIVPSNFLEMALFMEADRLGGLLDVLNETKLANQRDVVKNEKRQNYDNRPYGLVGARINETLYPENHPYHWLTIGSLDDLTAASVDDVKAFFRRYYTPSNASLAIAGDFNPQQARAWVEKYFGAIESGQSVGKVQVVQPRLEKEMRMEMPDRVALSRLYMVWHSMPQYTPDEAAADSLALILGGGKSSRLYKTLVYDKQIAQDVNVFNGSQELAGTFRIVATAKPGKSLTELETAINDELARIKQTPPTAEEIERAYNAREAAFVYSLQTVGGFGGRNDQLNQYAIYLNNPNYFKQDLARYAAVKAEDVQRIAGTYLTDKRLIVSVTPSAGRTGDSAAAATTTPVAPQQPAATTQAPTASAQSATTQAQAAQAARGDKPAGAQAVTKPEAAATTPSGATPTQANSPAQTSTASSTSAPSQASAPAKRDAKSVVASQSNLPKPTADPRFSLPRVERRTLSNGLTVLIVEHKELPVVSMNLVVKSGSEADSPKLSGLASLTADLLDEGTRTRNALQISDALASIGAQLGTNADFDSSGTSLRTLTRHLDRALDIYTDVLLNPAFPETDFKRLRDSRLTALRQRRDDANQIAGEVYPKIIYGENHPYGRSSFGTEDSLKAVTQTDARRYYETFYRPNNSTLIVVGDVTSATLLPKLEKAFAKWERAEVPNTSVTAPQARDKATIYLVDRPGAAQSVISIGQVGVERTTPDYFPLLVLNTMLGGQFVSRVNLNLREDKGYTYGARTSFDYRRGAGPFAASAGVQTAVTKEAVQEFMKELRGVRGEIPVTAQELEYNKQAIIRGFPRSFETPDQIATRLAQVALYGLPDEYYNSYIERVKAVSLDDVKRVANKYLEPSRMAILVVGDRKQIEPGLRAMDGATVTILDAEGRAAN